MARHARGEIIFFSMEEENPVIRDHLRERGKAVVLRPTRHGEMITLIEHRRDTSLLLAEEIPATLDGRIRVNIQNAMGAAAAAFAQDVQLEYIRHALRTFTSNFFQTPGRFNLLEIDGRKVLLDYCHNVAGLESMADFVKRMDADRTIAMIAIPGDRSDEDIAAFGRLAGGTFDQIVIREDANPRGRRRGEVADLLKEAIAGGGLRDGMVDIVLDEMEAARAAIGRAERNDLVVLFADRPAAVFEELTGRPI
jgi:cyanophycin synthetase